MKYDPFTLVVVIGTSGDAEGTLYLDDGESYDYEQGAYIHRKFSYSAATGVLMSEDLSTPGKQTPAYLKAMENVRVEKIIIVGAPNAWKGKSEVEVSEEQGGKSSPSKKVELTVNEASGSTAAWAVVRDPGVKIGAGWKISFG